jgi:hypothetical protein
LAYANQWIQKEAGQSDGFIRGKARTDLAGSNDEAAAAVAAVAEREADADVDI